MRSAKHAYVFPASFSQQRLWLLERLTPGQAFYNVPAALRLETTIDRAALQRAVDAVIRRHEILRTRFIEVDGFPLQVVAPRCSAPIRFIDLPGGDESIVIDDIERRARLEAAIPFDLTRAPLVRVAVLSAAARDRLLVITCHHCIADGASLEVLFRDLTFLYDAYTHGRRRRLPPLPTQFADYAVWQRTHYTTELRTRELEYWRRELADVPDALSLPADKPRRPEQRFQGATLPVTICRPLADRLRALARSHDATLFMLLVAALQALLSRYTAATDIVIGAPVTGRDHHHLDNVIGFFVNTVLIRTRFDDNPTVGDLLERVRRTTLGALAHQALPFEQLVSELSPRRALSHQPLCQVLFGLQSVNGASRGMHVDGTRRVAISTGTSKCDLTLSLTDTGAEVGGYLEYDTDLFEQGTISGMHDCFLTLLAGMAAMPGEPVSTVSVLPAEMRHELVELRNRTASAYPHEQSVHALVERRAALSPSAVAVVDGTATLTYEELCLQARALAARLRGAGVARGDRVGVCLHRSAAIVVAWLGVLEAGAAYVPLDPEYPQMRLAALLEDAGARVVVAGADTRDALPAGPRVIDIDGPGHTRTDVFESVDVGGSDPAYVIYTSGSTGTPKGTVIPHRAINRLVVNTNYISIAADDRIAQASNASFDAATFEVWGALMHGATVVIVPRHLMLDPSAFAAFLRANRITVLFLTTALFNQIVSECSGAFSSLRCLMVGGEMADAARFRDALRDGRPETLLNVYGPTETTTFATYFPVVDLAEDAVSIPIGRPIANTRVYVVDKDLQIVPAGAAGELVIAGDGVALEYLARPELSAQKFIEDRWHPLGGRAYRTGDLVRWRSDAVLEILGRLDDQVKIRGFRVEPAEVEMALARHPGVRQAVVIPRRDGGETRLVAYVVGVMTVSPAELRRFLRDRLPMYMLPATIVRLERLPLNANGKVDRAAMPSPDIRPLEEEAVPARTPVEAALVSIWASVLQRDTVGIHDNFFELGGDSIRAIQVVSRAARQGLRFTPRQLFTHQSIAALAAAIGDVVATPAEQGLVIGEVPLTPIQHWFFERLPAEAWQFNQAMMVELPGGVDVEALEDVARALVHHHDALRLRVDRVEGRWRQQLASPDERRLVSRFNAGAQGSATPDATARYAADVQRGLDLSDGPLLRMALFAGAAAQPSRLLIVVHHLAIDMVSWTILLEDLHLGLRQRTRGELIQLPPKTASFKAWAERLVAAGAASRPDALNWWLADDCPAASELPADFDYQPSANVVGTARTFTQSFEARTTDSILRGASRLNARIQQLVVAALVAAVRDWTGRQACSIDIEGHGRDALDEEVDVSRTVGWFTTITPVTFKPPDEGDDALALLRYVKERLEAIPRGSCAYGVLRYLAAEEAIRARAARIPESAIAFNYMGRSRRGGTRAADLEESAPTGPPRSPSGARRHLIEIDGGIVGERLTLHWTYSAVVHRDDTIRRVARTVETVLDRLVHTDTDPAPTRDEAYELSPLQEGMLFHALYDPRGGQYVVQSVMPLRDLDVPRFRAAWDAVVERNAILRTAFEWEGVDTPVQVVARAVTLRWDVQDWRAFSEEQRDAQLQLYLARERRAGFDTARAPLMRFALLRLSDDEWWFNWICHHLIVDGWSRPLLFRDVADAYDSLRRGEAIALPARRPYQEFVQWLRTRDPVAARRFWTEQLADFREPTPIVASLPASGGESSDEPFVSRTRVISEAATERLNVALRRQQLTLSTVVHGAWALLLWRYTRREDVVFGTTVAGRPAQLRDVEEMIGPFINTIPARVRIRPHERVSEWLRSLQEQLLAAHEYQYAPLVDARACSQVPPGRALFESLVVIENYLGMPSRQSRGARPTAVEWTNYPLTVTAIPGASLTLDITHAADIDARAVAGMLDQLACFLEAFAEDPERAAGALPLMSESERVSLLVEWNRTETNRGSASLLALIHQQARHAPAAVAVQCADQRLTYGSLMAWSRALAIELGSLAAGRGARVGLFLDRSIEIPVAMLAVLEAGAAYVPFDTTQPVERLALLLTDAGVSVVLTNVRGAAALAGLPVRVVIVGSLQSKGDMTETQAEDPAEAVQGVDPAYVVYTSGTTGMPKGVVVSHQALLNHALATMTAYSLRSSDRVLQFASPAFDVAAEEIFPTLAGGATVVMWPELLAPPVADLVSFIAVERLTVLNLPTPIWHEWVDEIDRHACPVSIRQVIVGTDKASAEKLSRWRAHTRHRQQLRWCNAYGCSETTITSTIYDPGSDALPLRGTVPIGRPIANTRVYVVDDALQPVPVGVPGELVIAGDGVALGYLNRPQQTAAHFIDERWRRGGGRAYRTGDLARWRSDGGLELIGRLDDQVKIRGYRVEPGEIEAVLEQHQSVRQAVVVSLPSHDETRLVAYFVAHQPVAIDTLRDHLRSRLPAYMLPSVFVPIDHVPLTSNGKIDRHALPPPVFQPTTAYEAPATAAERRIAAIWNDVLGVAAPGRDDNFFHLGGHSLTAARLIARVRQAFGTDVPLRAVFDHPTLRGLAACVETAPPEPSVETIPRRFGSGVCPLAAAQERLWFLDQLSPGTPVYNMPCSLQISGAINLPALEASLNEIVRRHDALRTTFSVADGRPVQVVAPELRLSMRVIDLTDVDDRQRHTEAVRIGTAESRRRFDLQRGPLIRAAALRLGPTDHVLLITMHHIVSDGWSVSILLRELEHCYDAFCHGRAPELPELPIQYGDYAVWQRDMLQDEMLQSQLVYWREQLAGAPPALELPTDRPRPPGRRSRGAYDTLALSPELTALLREFAGREGATIFMVILAAWQLILARWSGQDDVSVGTPVAGRQRAETEDLIGFFLNNLVMRTRLNAGASFCELVARVREVALGGLAHQDVPFETLLASLAPLRDASRTPLFQVFLNVLNFAEERMHLPAAVAESFSLASRRTAAVSPAGGARPEDNEAAEPDTWSQFDLTLYAGERDDRLRFVLVYDTDLFDRARMTDMLHQLASVLGQAVSHPQRALSQFDLVTSASRRVLPDPGAPLDDSWRGSVAQLFAAHAQTQPDRLAIDHGVAKISYQELEERSNQLAHALRAAGVRQGDVVALYAARCPSLVWGLLGIMKSGAAFAMLDPQYPAARLQAQVELAGPRAVLLLETAGMLPLALDSCFAAAGTVRIALPPFADDRARRAFDGFATSAPPVAVSADDMACIGFTSGSSGAPKGVIGRHGPLTHFVPWLARTFGLGADDRFSVLSGLSHDPLQREVFTPLCLGAAIVIAPAGTYGEPSRLAAWVAESRTTVAHLTPALGQLLVQAATPATEWPALRRAFFVGDVLRRHDLERMRSMAPAATCVNYYGTTETQRAVGHWVLPSSREGKAACVTPRADAPVPLGRGIEDVQLLVLNQAGALCGIGELGEIHVRSPHLAQGYLGDEALTQERFVVSPLSDASHDRLYRTGDLGRYLPDGTVAFAGRRDSQVKIRGFRVEPAEIEAVLSGCPGIRDVAVIAQEHPAADRRLVAYVVPLNGVPLSTASVRQFVAARLPGYMVPSHVMVLPSLPVTPNGKLDRRALPTAGEQPAASEAEAPSRSPTEAAVAVLWQHLGIAVKGVHAGFFESGGHSLLAASLVARVHERFGVQITLAEFFASPTIAALAATIDAARVTGKPLASPKPILRTAHKVPLGPDGEPVLSQTFRRQILAAFNGGQVQ